MGQAEARHEDGQGLRPAEAGNSHIGTGHLLLGVIREDEGIAARILGRLEVSVDAVREVVREEEARVRGLEEKDRRK